MINPYWAVIAEANGIRVVYCNFKTHDQAQLFAHLESKTWSKWEVVCQYDQYDRTDFTTPTTETGKLAGPRFP